jgi:hypothetical protein
MTASGLIAYTGRPVARSDATNRPRGVSIATGTGSSAQSPAAVSISINSANPLGSSVMRLLATSWPLSSMMAVARYRERHSVARSKSDHAPEARAVANPGKLMMIA